MRNKIKKATGVLAASVALLLAGCTEGTGAVQSETGGTGGVHAKQAADESQAARNPVEGTMRVSYIDVGQADATLIETTSHGESYTMLVDTGNLGATDTVEYLKSHQVEDIDVVVGTHPHADHIGQMDKVLENFGVGEVWMSGDTTTSQIYQDVMEAVDTTGIGYEEPRAGDVFDIGEMEVTILSPTAVNGNLNDGSIGMRIVFGDVDFVFTGDGETAAEQGILSKGVPVSAKIMKLGHHGSKTSTTPSYFNAVSPEVAIYSAGKGNSYGHPSKEVVDRVQGAGVQLYGTDANGTIVVTTDGKTYDVKTSKDEKIVPGDVGATVATEPAKKPDVDKPTTPVIESKEPTTPTVPDTHGSQATGGSCVDINTATKEDLMTIVHVGDVRADDIIASRPYASVDELTKVKGIAEGRLADMKEEGLACVK